MVNTMKILLTCDPEIPVPPLGYGGVERLVDGLAASYQKMGHKVYLLANKKSDCKFALQIFPWPANSSLGFKNIIINARALQAIITKIKPDVVHSFSRLLYMYPSFFTSKIPFVQTYGRFISPNSTTLASFVGGKKLHFTAAGTHMLNHLTCYKHKFTTIYNFTPVNYFVPDNTIEKTHLMFLGRIEDIKGTKECIEVALATQSKLIIAGNIQEGHDNYFNTFIKPHLNNPLIEYVGQVNDEQKLYYLQRARAFLFPIKWEEPFGIVMAEAMACGVPVIGFRRGSVPEVIKHGKNGFIVDTVDEMIDAIKKIDELNRKEVREDCVSRFSPDVIAQQYLTLLDQMIKQNS
jgi:glycosyltransferase involved in cell wall biosynthesis